MQRCFIASFPLGVFAVISKVVADKEAQTVKTAINVRVKLRAFDLIFSNKGELPCQRSECLSASWARLMAGMYSILK